MKQKARTIACLCTLLVLGAGLPLNAAVTWTATNIGGGDGTVTVTEAPTGDTVNLVMPSVYGSFIAINDQGVFASGLQVQNAGTDSAQITVRYSGANGEGGTSIAGPMIRAGADPAGASAASFFMALLPDRCDGWTRLETGSRAFGSADLCSPGDPSSENSLHRLQLAAGRVVPYLSIDNGQTWQQAAAPQSGFTGSAQLGVFGTVVRSGSGSGSTLPPAQVSGQATFRDVSLSATAELASYTVTTAATGGNTTNVFVNVDPIPGASGFNVSARQGEQGPVIPLIRNRSFGTMTGLQIQNIGSTEVNVTVNYTPAGTQSRGGAHILQTGEGPPVTRQVMPLVGVPVGWFGYSMFEGPRSGGATFNPASGEMTLSAYGWGGSREQLSLPQNGDQGYLLYQPVTGPFVARATVLTLPTATHPFAMGGLTLRESLDQTSRFISAVATAERGLWDMQRGTAPGGISWLQRLQPAAMQLPIVLQMTRTVIPVRIGSPTGPVMDGDRVETSYSLDGGATFQALGRKVFVQPRLPATVPVGLISVSNDRANASVTRFRDIRIQTTQ